MSDLSPDTLVFFKELLGKLQLQVPVDHPDFEPQAIRMSKAKRELDAAISAVEGPDLEAKLAEAQARAERVGRDESV